ncbi:hypothetical protein KSD_30090 [Ktedonobacter sp. SOSP1-85]|nr:hypothetical protein KSD_30090 [Ktedonobacter sp. SOSP1-85]
MQIKDHTLARWVQTGLIPIAVTHGNAQYFDQEAVRQFMTSYINTNEAATILGVGKLTTQKWAHRGRLAPACVSGPHIDGYHAYLFDKEQLIRWRQEHLTFGDTVQLLGISKATLHRWVTEGKLQPLDNMGGKQRWFAQKRVLEFLERKAAH